MPTEDSLLVGIMWACTDQRPYLPPLGTRQSQNVFIAHKLAKRPLHPVLAVPPLLLKELALTCPWLNVWL